MNKKGRIALVGAEDEENLAIRYLAAVLNEKQYQVKIVPCTRYEDIPSALKKIKSFNPQMVGISMGFQSLALMFLDFAQKLKETLPETHITVGGHFPTFEYEKLLEYDAVDSVIRFEGEIPVGALMDAVVNEKKLDDIPNLVYRDPVTNNIQKNPFSTHFHDLDSIPFPLRNKNPHIRLGERFATLVASRGCFHSRCIYCCIGTFHNEKIGPKYALRNMENVAQEMQELYHEYGVRLFQFHDDNFLLPSPESNLRRLKDLKSHLMEKNVDMDKIGILIKLRPDNLNPDIITALKELGIIGIFLGVENASASGLKALGRGSSKKEINYSMELLENYDISVTFNLLMFHPRATLSEINENIVFMQQNLDKAYDFGRAEIVSGSPLETLTRRKKLIYGNWPHWNYRIEDDAVEKMFRLISLTFYHEDSAYSELSHKNIALSYRAQLIKHLYPGNPSEKLLKKNSELIKRFNKFNLEIILQIYHLTGENDWQDGLEEINYKLQKNFPDFIKDTNNLSQKMLKLQLLEQGFQKQGLENYLQNSSFWRKIFRI
jgi:anaerobic magnesium-protoporphyrin IX monomethyl ester cyclase